MARHDRIEYIRWKVPTTEILAQLAEEAAELSQAALKLRRVIDKTNPTPVGRAEAWANIREEVSDVAVCLLLLELDSDYTVMDAKLRRWAGRLKEAERNG